MVSEPTTSDPLAGLDSFFTLRTGTGTGFPVFTGELCTSWILMPPNCPLLKADLATLNT